MENVADYIINFDKYFPEHVQPVSNPAYSPKTDTASRIPSGCFYLDPLTGSGLPLKVTGFLYHQSQFFSRYQAAYSQTNYKMASALAGVAVWIEHSPANQRVTGSIPSQGTCLGLGPGPQ